MLVPGKKRWESATSPPPHHDEKLTEPPAGPRSKQSLARAFGEKVTPLPRAELIRAGRAWGVTSAR